MKKIIVLGAGLIGKAIAIDLCSRYEVTSADIQMCSLEMLSPQYNITVVPSNFNDNGALRELIRPFDLVISAVPGSMGFKILETIVDEGKNVVDISFFPEDPFRLNELAKKRNITAIVDCGAAPGLCNMIAGNFYRKIKILRYECMVGGLPLKPAWPFHYKAVFSPADVIEEYTRPARLVENGCLITKEALSDVEKIYFDELGELEAFNSDGLRTLLRTMPDVPFMKEKTLRYPGHAELMKIFRHTGLFSKERIDINGESVVPLKVMSRLLFPIWKMEEGEEDITLMRVVIKSKNEEMVFSLHDRYDKTTRTTSMARTTAYTCTAAATALLENQFTRKGICPPEFLGEDENCFNAIVNYLGKRGVVYKKEILQNAEGVIQN